MCITFDRKYLEMVCYFEYVKKINSVESELMAQTIRASFVVLRVSGSSSKLYPILFISIFYSLLYQFTLVFCLSVLLTGYWSTAMGRIRYEVIDKNETEFYL